MRGAGLIVKKIGMSRILDDDGQMIPVTLLQADTQRVTKILTPERDGYKAVQVGYYAKPESKLNKPDLHRLKKSGVEEGFTRFLEFRDEKAAEEWQVGTLLDIKQLTGVQYVDVTGLTKGRGFQGPTKRWNSATGPRTHGSRYHRRGGSLGSNTTPGRVYKNKKMAGHMGVAKRTIQNLSVVSVDEEMNVIALKGSVPGHKNGYLVLRPSLKKHGNNKN